MVIGRVFLAGAALLCGASIGREGPTVHVGAVIVHSVSRWMPKGRMPGQRHAMVLAGGAAGVVAAFRIRLWPASCSPSRSSADRSRNGRAAPR